MFTPFTKNLFSSENTFKTSLVCHLSFSFPDITCTLSQVLIFIIFLLNNYKTSGAKLTIFWYHLFLNSLATGPKTRVHFGSPLSSIITQALSSNLRYEASSLLISLVVLTITAFTTFFFFTVQSGVAFLTEQTITSQIEAYLL
jgi:hypothetical protein